MVIRSSPSCSCQRSGSPPTVLHLRRVACDVSNPQCCGRKDFPQATENEAGAVLAETYTREPQVLLCKILQGIFSTKCTTLPTQPHCSDGTDPYALQRQSGSALRSNWSGGRAHMAAGKSVSRDNIASVHHAGNKAWSSFCNKALQFSKLSSSSNLTILFVLVPFFQNSGAARCSILRRDHALDTSQTPLPPAALPDQLAH